MSPFVACDTPFTPDCEPRPAELDTQVAALLHDHGLEIRDLIRSLLPTIGLRNSLFRVKVLALLLHSASERLDAVRVHALLEEQVGMSFKLANTRDVLRRLARAGLAVQSEHGRYSVSAQAVSALYTLARQAMADSMVWGKP